MRNIIFGMLVIAAFAFIVNCGGDACEDLADEYKDLVCAEDGCGPDSPECKAYEDAEDASDDDDDAECTESAEAAMQKLVDDFDPKVNCSGAAADDDDDDNDDNDDDA